MELKLFKVRPEKDQNHARIQKKKLAQKREMKRVKAAVGPNGQKDENITLSKSNQTCLTDIKL